MGSSKIVGWVLLFLGLLIISYSLYSSYQIFTGEKQAPEIFATEESSEELSQEGIKIPLPGMEVEFPLPEQLQKIFSLGLLSPKIFNLVSWSIWASLLIFGGSIISSLGIKLIK